jgi:hypothetical protein
MLGQLADYVRTRCDDVLWADAARDVRALIREGHVRAAVSRYFERTGERWDAERLELVTFEDADYVMAHENLMADARR